MIANFEDFCTWMYVIIDDLYEQIAPLFIKPGPEPVCSDSELITMLIVGECREWDKETNLVAEWRNYPQLFPHVPTRSRLNRRRRNLLGVINLMRQYVLQVLEIAQDRQCLIDSLPVPVVGIHLAPQASAEWASHEARYGTVSTKKLPIFGYKLHLLVTLGGLILDFVLVPANVDDRQTAWDLLDNHTDLEVFGDKGYVSALLAEELRRTNRIRLIALRRRNQKEPLPDALRRAIVRVRQIIETVNGQLDEHFNIETNHAHSFWGLCARLYTKLAAHTLCVYLNQLLDNPDWLRLKRLAFPGVVA